MVEVEEEEDEEDVDALLISAPLKLNFLGISALLYKSFSSCLLLKLLERDGRVGGGFVGETRVSMMSVV